MSNLRDPFAEGAPASPARPRPAAPVIREPAPASAPPHPGWHRPSHLTLVVVVALAVAAQFVGFVVGYALTHHRPDDSPSAERFVPIGRAYGKQLGLVYARAWEDGAKLLDAGQGPQAALDTVAKSWDAGRIKLFERLVTPELARVVPEDKPDKEITPDDRAALARAWRGFARGLEGSR